MPGIDKYQRKTGLCQNKNNSNNKKKNLKSLS